MICSLEVPSDGELDSHIDVSFRPLPTGKTVFQRETEKLKFSFQNKTNKKVV